MHETLGRRFASGRRWTLSRIRML